MFVDAGEPAVTEGRSVTFLPAHPVLAGTGGLSHAGYVEALRFTTR